MSATRTATVTNLGCKVNQAEMDAVRRTLRSGGIRIVGDEAAADIVVVNTCTVTGVADQKSRQAVRRARRRNPGARIIVTGCAVQVDPGQFTAGDPLATLVDSRVPDALLAEVKRLIGSPSDGPLPTLSGVEPVVQSPLAPLDSSGEPNGHDPGERTRAFIKLQDGCSFHCTYCIIPRARGVERSLAPEAVLADVRRAIASGQREIVLTGINIGTYDGGASEPGPRGSHRWEALSLPGLIRRILAETPIERLRLSSIEPQHVTDELLQTWTESEGRCLPHFHLPLQAGDDGVLRRMGRRYETQFYEGLVDRIRVAIPRVAVHADVIVGFPTEDDAAWRRSLEFIAGLELAGIHIFRYSERPGTAATRMQGQVPEAVRKERATELLAHAAERRATFAAEQVGRRAGVLFERQLSDGRWQGHAENHVLVSAFQPARASLENAIATVAVDRVDDAADRVTGEVVSVSSRARPRVLPVLNAVQGAFRGV